MQAITTKYLCATNCKPSRVKATAEVGSVIVSCDGALRNDDDHHREAALALCRKFGWEGSLVMGTTHHGDNVWVFIHNADVVRVGEPNKKLVPTSPSWSPTEFIDYLQATLIPDLRESGRDCTADDFETAISLIEQLQAERAEAIER